MTTQTKIRLLNNRSRISESDPDYQYIIQQEYLEDMEENEKLSIFNSAIFKTLMTNENNKKYICKLLSYILNIPDEILSEELQFGKNESDQKNRMDLVAYADDSSIDIEIDYSKKTCTLEYEPNYMNYFFYKNEGIEKNSYSTQKILININNFAYKGKDKVKYVYRLKDEDNEILTDKLIVIQIYIPNLVKKWHTTGIESLTEEERFLLVLTIDNIDNAKAIVKRDQIMEEAIEITKKNSEIQKNMARNRIMEINGLRASNCIIRLITH